MPKHSADHSRNPGKPGAPRQSPGGDQASDPASRLRNAKLGAFFRPGQALDVGLTREELRTLVRRAVVDHAGRGLYRFADVEPTESYSLAMACARIPRGIVCLLSALRVHDIGTQSPPDVWLAIAHKARKPRFRGVRFRLIYFSGAAATVGIDVTNFEGVPARITSPARTIVDCFRFERLVGRETAIEALNDGLRRRKATVGELAHILEKLPSRRLSAAIDLRSI